MNTVRIYPLTHLSTTQMQRLRDALGRLILQPHVEDVVPTGTGNCIENAWKLLPF